MATINIRVLESEKEVYESFAHSKGYANLSQFVRQTLHDLVEDEMDFKLAEAAMAEYEKNPVSYTLEEMSARRMASRGNG